MIKKWQKIRLRNNVLLLLDDISKTEVLAKVETFLTSMRKVWFPNLGRNAKNFEIFVVFLSSPRYIYFCESKLGHDSTL